MTNVNPDQFGYRRLEEENLRLKHAVDELSILNELATAIGGLNSSEDVIRKIISRSLRAVNAEQGVITVVDEQPNEPMKTLVRTMVSSADRGQFHFNQALLGWMIMNKKPLTVNDPPHDERFRGIPWDGSVHSVLCVPMLVRSALKGVLAVYNKKAEEGFTTDDQRLLAIIAAQSAQVMENARLREEERSLIKMQEEFRLAAQIQADLLPKEPPNLSGYDVAGATFSARSIGGDYFDFIPLDGKRIALCVGDVSGKGLTAALLMANLQASLRSQSYMSTSVKECIGKVNHHLFESTSPEKFATVFYGVLDAVNNKLTYCNAGHEMPILFEGNGTADRLKEGGTVVGIMDGFEFQESTIDVAPADTLVIFSDGVTEAMNSDREQFGEKRLIDTVCQHPTLSAQGLVGKIVEAVRTHAGEAPQSDDITALVVKRKQI